MRMELCDSVEFLRSWQAWFLCFNGIQTFLVYLLPKPPLLKNNSDTIKSIAWWGVMRFISFFKNISLKMNTIERLEFELAYNDITDQHSSHYPHFSHLMN